MVRRCNSMSVLSEVSRILKYACTFLSLSSGARGLNVGLGTNFHFLYIHVSEQRGWAVWTESGR